jgi:hypothetical protein
MYLLHNLIFFFIFTENLKLPQIFQEVAHPEVGKYFHEFVIISQTLIYFTYNVYAFEHKSYLPPPELSMKAWSPHS